MHDSANRRVDVLCEKQFKRFKWVHVIDLYCSRLFINSHSPIYHPSDTFQAIERMLPISSLSLSKGLCTAEVRTLIKLKNIRDEKLHKTTMICYSWDRGLFLSHVQISIKFEHHLNINGSLFVHIIDCTAAEKHWIIFLTKLSSLQCLHFGPWGKRFEYKLKFTPITHHSFILSAFSSSEVTSKMQYFSFNGSSIR